jgi:hypothetical protein
MSQSDDVEYWRKRAAEERAKAPVPEIVIIRTSTEQDQLIKAASQHPEQIGQRCKKAWADGCLCVHQQARREGYR